VKERKEKHRNFGRKNRQEPLKSGAGNAILELPPAPFVLATALWERDEIGGQKRTKSGEKVEAEGRIRASKAYAKREEKQKQKQPNSPNAYPINTHPKSSLKRFDAPTMDPKEEAEAEDEGSEGSQEETILVTRYRRGGNFTVRYVDSASSSSWNQGK
jgi:hypothetical protein